MPSAIDIPDAELAVLQELWQREAATVRELTEALYGNTAASLLATVQKLLDRLEAKDCVRRDRAFRPHQYQAAIARAELVGNRLQATADKLCDGELAPLLSHLVKGAKLSTKDRAALRSLLDDLDGDKGKKK